MAHPNGHGGWNLTDEDVAEIAKASFGPDDTPIMPEQDNTLVIPYDGNVHTSVWGVDPHLQLFTNVMEQNAKDLAEENPNYIFFFAEFAPPGTLEELTMAEALIAEIDGRVQLLEATIGSTITSSNDPETESGIH